MSNTKTEAQRLAEFKDLEYWPAGVGLTDWVESVCAEMLRLDAALADELNNRDVLDKMLTQCITERDQLRAQVERLQGGEPVTLTDEYVASHLEAAGVKFQRFKGGISGTKDCWSTSGSQDVRKLANGVRAIIAALREKEAKATP